MLLTGIAAARTVWLTATMNMEAKSDATIAAMRRPCGYLGSTTSLTSSALCPERCRCCSASMVAGSEDILVG